MIKRCVVGQISGYEYQLGCRSHLRQSVLHSQNSKLNLLQIVDSSSNRVKIGVSDGRIQFIELRPELPESLDELVYPDPQ